MILNKKKQTKTKPSLGSSLRRENHTNGGFGSCYFLLTHHYLIVGLIFTEAIQDDVSRDAHNTEDATLGAPADHLDSEGVFLHQLGRSAFAHFWLLKHLGGFQLVQHL